MSFIYYLILWCWWLYHKICLWINALSILCIMIYSLHPESYMKLMICPYNSSQLRHRPWTWSDDPKLTELTSLKNPAANITTNQETHSSTERYTIAFVSFIYLNIQRNSSHIIQKNSSLIKFTKQINYINANKINQSINQQYQECSKKIYNNLAFYTK